MSGRAAAFVKSDEFSAYPDKKLGGGGGRYFTGSPAEGFDCSVCHMAPTDYHYPLVQKGLPLDGYVPGTQREITLSWPEATAAQREASARGLKPQIALMAEFVSEDGGNAGKLEFMELTIRKEGFCELLQGAEKAAFAGTIIATTKAKPPLIITPEVADADPEKRVCQTGGADERRCLLWVDPCGAQSMKFKWTAPPQLHGPVWFSAGLVVTHDGTSKPNDADYTTLLSIPMNAASDGKTYKENLESGCSVSGAPHMRSAPRAGMWWAMISALGCVQWIRRRHRAGLASNALALALALGLGIAAPGCSDAPITSTASGAVGRFEPVACVGCDMLGPSKCRSGDVDSWKMCNKANAAGAAAPRSAGSAGSASLAMSTLGNATGAGAAPVATGSINGKLLISFTTSQPPGLVSVNFDDCLKVDKACVAPNYTAIWLTDAAGKYVKMLEHNGGRYQTSLTGYIRLGEDCVCEVDVVTTPTKNFHYQHDIVWNGRDAQGNAVPYGTYNLNIELAIGNNQDWLSPPIPFEIKPPPFTGQWPLLIPPAVPHAGVSLNYLPNP